MNRSEVAKQAREHKARLRAMGVDPEAIRVSLRIGIFLALASMEG